MGHEHGLADELLEAAGVGMWVQDPAGRIIHVNEALARLWGSSRKRVLDKRAWDFVESVSETALTTMLTSSRAGSGGVQIEWRGERGVSWSSLVYATYRRGPVGRISALVVDVSAHRPSWLQLRDTVAGLVEMSSKLHHSAGRRGAPERDGDVMALLSRREREIIGDLAEGRDIPAICVLREIAEHTVRNHIKNAYKKLGVHSRVQLFAAIHGM